MSSERRANLFSAQAVRAAPFVLDVCVSAILLNALLAVGTKDLLPCQSEPLVEVTNIHDPLLNKSLRYLGTNLVENLAHIRQGRFSSGGWCFVAVEIQL